MDYLFIGIGSMFGLIGIGIFWGVIDLEDLIKAWRGNQKQITYVFDLDSLSTRKLEELRDKIDERLSSRSSSISSR